MLLTSLKMLRKTAIVDDGLDIYSMQSHDVCNFFQLHMFKTKSEDNMRSAVKRFLQPVRF